MDERAPITTPLPEGHRERRGLAGYLRLWWVCFKNCLSREMEFKLHFWLSLGGDILYYTAHLAFFEILYGNPQIANIGGWTLPQIYVLMGTFYVVDALMMLLLMGNVFRLGERIRTGELDFYLTKPVHPMFLVSTRYVQPQYAINVLFSVGLVVYGASRLGAITLGNVALYAFMVGNGFLLLYSTAFLTQCSAFWLVRVESLQWAYFRIYAFAMKPDGIYSGILRYVLLTLLPAILIASLPARTLFGRYQGWEIAWAVGLNAVVLWVAARVFNYALRHYGSASS